MKPLHLLFAMFVFMAMSCTEQNQSNGIESLEPVSDRSDFVESNPGVVVSKEKAPIRSDVSAANAKVSNSTGDFARSHRKMIRTAQLSFNTQDLGSSKKRMDSLVQSFGGYYESEWMDNNEEMMSLQLSIRVPCRHFDALLSGCEKGGEELSNKNVSVEDRSEEYTDLDTRLKNKRAYVERYRQLIRQAKSVKDILEIEEKLRGIEEEIESTVARLNTIDEEAAMSRITVNLVREKVQVYKPDYSFHFWEQCKQSLQRGWLWVIHSVLLICSAWPLGILLFVLAWILRRVLRRRNNKKPA